MGVGWGAGEREVVGGWEVGGGSGVGGRREGGSWGLGGWGWGWGWGMGRPIRGEKPTQIVLRVNQ